MGNGEELEVNAHSIKVALPVRAKAVAAGKLEESEVEAELELVLR